jgi:phosphoenolpyruvate carboxylase
MTGQNNYSISQNPDVRLLGKMLGDVIRAYGGEKLFRQTEYIRSTSGVWARSIWTTR